MEKIGLVLEGGGMRGAYTAGVLDWLLENELYFDYVSGISSGAMYAAMYMLRKRETLHSAAVNVAADPRNVGIKAIRAEKTIVGYEFLYNEVTKNLDFPLESIDKIEGDIEIGVYDMKEQKTIWVDKHQIAQDPKFIQAACVLPIFGKQVKIKGKYYMDGGITTMIPIEQSIAAGCTKHMVVTTKSSDYVRKEQNFFQKHLLRFVYRKFPQLIHDFEARKTVYYEERERIDALVEEGNGLYMFPTQELGVSRFGGDAVRFQQLFDIARADCEARRDEIVAFYQSTK